jgi:hypothetical protein
MWLRYVNDKFLVSLLQISISDLNISRLYKEFTIERGSKNEIPFLDVLFEPPLWSSGQSSWLQIQRYCFDSRRYQIFWVVGLERGPLSLASTIEELLWRKNSGSGLENRDYGRRDPSRWPRGTPYPQTLALTSQTNRGRSVGIVRSRTQATELFFFIPRRPVMFLYFCVLCNHAYYCDHSPVKSFHPRTASCLHPSPSWVVVFESLTSRHEDLCATCEVCARPDNRKMISRAPGRLKDILKPLLLIYLNYKPVIDA